MMDPRSEPASSPPQVPRTIRRVALGATLSALVLYLLVSAIADLVVINRFSGAIDARLEARLAEVVHTLPRAGPKGPIGAYQPQVSGDLDDAPIVLWWVAPGSARAVRLDTNSPALPATALRVSGPVDATVAGSTFRFESVAFAGGRIIGGTSAQELRSAWSILLAIEGALLPIVLITLYMAAWIIGRRATTPIERARRRQLAFTADASHELRTPLSVVEAEVGLALSADRSSASYRAALERVADESKRLRVIVEDLLWLARLDALPAIPPYETVDIARLAAVCAQRFAAVAQRRGITLSVLEGSSEAPVVVASADWLDRLLSVLLDNACRYADDGGRVEVVVTTTRERVVVTVNDSGPGIAVEDGDRIFERFHRASAVPGGAGLGLSIADAVVKATDGQWQVTRPSLGGAGIIVSWPRFRVRREEHRDVDPFSNEIKPSRSALAGRKGTKPRPRHHRECRVLVGNANSSHRQVRFLRLTPRGDGTRSDDAVGESWRSVPGSGYA